MKLDEIIDGIKQDSNIDLSELDRESVKIPLLISKWTQLFIHESRLLRELELQWKIAFKDQTEYYLGRSPDHVYEQTPLELKILRQDLQLYLDADPILVKLEARRFDQRLKCETIEQFIKNLNQRSFTISNAIRFMMFKNGLNG
jgi:hypothetical protein